MSLFRTTEEIKEFFPVGLTLEVDDLQPTIREVESEVLRDQVLGEAQYNELHSAYQSNSLTSDQTKLLKLCQTAVARLALHRYVPEANVSFNSGGLTVANNPQAGVAPASEWRTRDVERRLLHSGYRALDAVLAYLLANMLQFITWAMDPIVNRKLGYLRFARHMNEYVPIAGSEWFFVSMRPIIKRIEQGQIPEVLCSSTLIDNLPNIDEDQIEPYMLALFRLAQQATAHLAMADAIIELGVGKDERGIYTFAALSSSGVSVGFQPASGTQRDVLIEHHRKLGNAALDALKKLLQKQAEGDNLHPYRSTPCYQDPNAVPPSNPRTDGTDYHGL